MNNKINNSVKSLDNQAKEDSETINKVEVIQKPLDRSKSGTDNPAKWGKHNPNYNKVYLSESKRKAL